MAKELLICGVGFPRIDYGRALDVFQRWIDQKTAHHVCIVNVHTLVMGLRDPEFQGILDSAAMATMDGQPLRWYANAVYNAGISERVCGPELMSRCMEQGVSRGWRHYLLGGREDVLEQLGNKLCNKYPRIQLAGMYSPPFRSLSDEEQMSIIHDINEARPDFLWVGLGAPRQEKWISSNLDKVNVPVQVGVGAAFDFHAGKISRAPSVLQGLGLEWAYRVANDPRLLGRYLSTNPVFMSIFLRDWLNAKILGRRPGMN